MAETEIVEGVLTRVDRFTVREKVSYEKATMPRCRLYLDGSDEPVGWVDCRLLLNRIEKGERVRIWRTPGRDKLRKIRPADRKLRWWQF